MNGPDDVKPTTNSTTTLYPNPPQTLQTTLIHAFLSKNHELKQLTPLLLSSKSMNYYVKYKGKKQWPAHFPINAVSKFHIFGITVIPMNSYISRPHIGFDSTTFPFSNFSPKTPL